MQLSLAFTAIICFVEHATLVQGVRRIVPKDILDISRAYHHSSSVDINLRRDAHNIVDHALHQERNVVRPSDAAFPSSKISSRAIAAATEEKNTWNSTTEAACLKALKATETNTKNLAGLAGCYNIKYFNSSSGVFQADLRLYRTAPASGDWSTADSQSYQISLSCDGASVATDSARLIKRQDEMLSWPPVRRSTLAKTYFRRSATAPPKMVQQMNFAGMINETLMGKINDVNAVRTYIAPRITVSGTAKDGKTLSTDIPTNKTSFVTGELANQVSTTASSGPSTPSVSETGSPPNATTKAFVLPGKTLGIFPVGLIITCTWTLLFLGTVGIGTVDRIRFRDAYRRRMKMEMGKGVARI